MYSRILGIQTKLKVVVSIMSSAIKWRRNFRDKEMVSLAKALKVEINYKNSLFCTLKRPSGYFIDPVNQFRKLSNHRQKATNVLYILANFFKHTDTSTSGH
jgi:hypothetical protein